jgi:hypothetical protein
MKNRIALLKVILFLSSVGGIIPTLIRSEGLRKGRNEKSYKSINRIQLLIGVEDEDSCGKSETGETPQERSDEEAHRPPAESEVLHGNQKRH